MWTQDTFTDYLMTFLWKTNDAVLSTSLPTLISLAYAELNRKLVITRRETVLVVAEVGGVAALPADFQNLINVADATYGDYTRLTAHQYAKELASNGSNQTLPYYRVVGTEFHFIGASDVVTPREVTVTYRATLPLLPADGLGVASWLAEDYLDVLTYAALKHTAPWLREDERIQVWDKYYSDALGSTLEEDVHSVINEGSARRTSFPSQVSVQRRR